MEAKEEAIDQAKHQPHETVGTKHMEKERREAQRSIHELQDELRRNAELACIDVVRGEDRAPFQQVECTGLM